MSTSSCAKLIESTSYLPLYNRFGTGLDPFGSSKTFFYHIPVDNIPNRVYIVRSHVPVVDVIGMLPNINSQERFQTSGGFQRILIWARGNIEFACLRIVSEPAPSTSLNCHSSGTHLCFHSFQTS